jgi:hypothetical protein
MALVYFLMGLLTLMLGLTLVRYVVFTAVWIVTGHSLWVFPNMMEEQVRDEGFRFVFGLLMCVCMCVNVVCVCICVCGFICAMKSCYVYINCVCVVLSVL